MVAGVQVCNAPVEYLGAYLGMGDLTSLNFEQPLRVAWNKIWYWNKQNLSLFAHVTVLKTFVFSLFVHVLNCVWITPLQLDIIQKMLNDFLWKGLNKVKQSTAYANLDHGGLKMIHI